ncbi:MAG: hypothetical protein IPL61_29895 [Myxococcales bacterium]|nr:hypothetical protein [Myxococcales bacterium]
MRQRLRTVLLGSVLVLVAASACGSPAVKDRSPRPDGVYEEFDVTMLDSGTCLAASRREFECPPGGTCTAPPAKPVACPAGLTAGATVRLVMTNDLTCNVDGAPTGCPEHDEGPVDVPAE